VFCSSDGWAETSIPYTLNHTQENKFPRETKAFPSLFIFFVTSLQMQIAVFPCSRKWGSGRNWKFMNLDFFYYRCCFTSVPRILSYFVVTVFTAEFISTGKVQGYYAVTTIPVWTVHKLYACYFISLFSEVVWVDASAGGSWLSAEWDVRSGK
jgi:hypothetical protein